LYFDKVIRIESLETAFRILNLLFQNTCNIMENT